MPKAQPRVGNNNSGMSGHAQAVSRKYTTRPEQA